MKKRNWIKLSSLIFGSIIGGTMMLTPLFAIALNTNSNNVLPFSISHLYKTANHKAVSPNLKILNPGDTTSPLFDAVKKMYNSRPSQIQDNQIKNIIEIINSNVPDTGVNEPVYTNLSRHQPGLNLTNDDPLGNFIGNTADIYTPNYMDKNGLFAFKVQYKDGNIDMVEYYLISGFNSTIINKTLPGKVFENSVVDLTDADLVSYIFFSDPSTTSNGYVTPNSKTLVPNSRIQNSSNGTISYALALKYDVPPIKFKTEINPALQQAEYNVETNFDVNLSFSGFQPSGNLSKQKLFELLGLVVGVSILFILFVIVTVLIIKRIKFKNSM